MSAENFIPKEATQQSEFLKKYPNYDGRGIKIAIIDVEIVDKNLPGMQKTTTGLPKMIECFSEYSITVDTSKVVERNGKNYIIGLKGEKLYIPIKWKNPSDKWHLGSKSVFDMKKDGMSAILLKSDVKKKNLASLKRETINCIVWFDGAKWRACVDTSPSCNFSNVEKLKILSNFDDGFEYVPIYNHKRIDGYCVNISNDGNSIKISFPYSEHAILVAHVAAANFSDNPEFNGLAPGAQIVSFHTLDLNDRLRKCIEHKVDIVNFSIGIHHFYFEQSLIVETLNEMVEKHGIIITQAAGNSGPLYSSIWEQYSLISDQMFIIGSVYTAEMVGKNCVVEKHKKNKIYPFVSNYSSKGPFLTSGARGVDFVSPGAAIADHPKWNKKENKTAHGTSYAAPNAAGSIACLLSALKANKISYSPAMIKAALANTAFMPEGGDKLAFGNGIIQINDAFEFIKKSKNYLPKKLTINFLKPKLKGIVHIIKDFQNRQKLSTKIFKFQVEAESKTKWILKCTSNDKNFVINCKPIKNNIFNFKIDVNKLEEGNINYAEIQGFDSLNQTIGPLFYLLSSNNNYFSSRNLFFC